MGNLSVKLLILVALLGVSGVSDMESVALDKDENVQSTVIEVNDLPYEP